MPHVDITMIPGRNDTEKQDIARKVQEFLAGELGIGKDLYPSPSRMSRWKHGMLIWKG